MRTRKTLSENQWSAYVYVKFNVICFYYIIIRRFYERSQIDLVVMISSAFNLE